MVSYLIFVLGQVIQWFGFFSNTTPWNGANASYTIDGGHPVQFSTIPQSSPNEEVMYAAPRIPVPLEQQLLFKSSKMPYANHSLHVTFAGGNDAVPLTLQYLVVQAVEPTVLPKATITEFEGFTPSTTSAVPVGTSILGVTMSSAASGTSLHRPNTGAIIGGSIAGIIFIIVSLFALGFMLLRRRTTPQQTAHESVTPPSVFHLHPDPFNIPANDERRIIEPRKAQDIQNIMSNPPIHALIQSSTIRWTGSSSEIRRGRPISEPVMDSYGETETSQAALSSLFGSEDHPSGTLETCGHSNQPTNLPISTFENAVETLQLRGMYEQDSGIRLPPIVPIFPPLYTTH